MYICAVLVRCKVHVHVHVQEKLVYTACVNAKCVCVSLYKPIYTCTCLCINMYLSQYLSLFASMCKCMWLPYTLYLSTIHVHVHWSKFLSHWGCCLEVFDVVIHVRMCVIHTVFSFFFLHVVFSFVHCRVLCTCTCKWLFMYMYI